MSEAIFLKMDQLDLKNHFLLQRALETIQGTLPSYSVHHPDTKSKETKALLLRSMKAVNQIVERLKELSDDSRYLKEKKKELVSLAECFSEMYSSPLDSLIYNVTFS